MGKDKDGAGYFFQEEGCPFMQGFDLSTPKIYLNDKKCGLDESSPYRI